MDDTPTNLGGKFLIALPSMGDPRFEQAVIYICSHDESGAMGLIINKLHEQSVVGPVSLSEMLQQAGIEGPVNVADTPVLNGGPVDVQRGFVLHSADYFNEGASLKLSSTLTLTSTRDVLEALVSEESPAEAILAVG
jgi:putative transcriptional regulator